MAKTIKFNLILDDKPVRTIEDLRENFSIEDMLELYNNGLLQRWLDVRGYSEILDQVKSINVNPIYELIKIFDIECNDGKIKEGVAILEYKNHRKQQFDEYNKLNFKTQAVIDDYHSGYRALIDDIIQNANDMARIKADIKEIGENYIGLFILNFYDLFFELIVKAPLSIFAILMNDKLRTYFITELNEDIDYNYVECFEYDKCYDESLDNFIVVKEDPTKQVYTSIMDYIEKKAMLKKKLGKELKVFSGDTEAYWKDIEPKGKKVMIISMEYGNYIRNAGKFGEELSSEDINGKFVILDGIDYKSNNNYQEILYMEV